MIKPAICLARLGHAYFCMLSFQGRTDEQGLERTDTQPIERADAQPVVRADAQLVVRASAQSVVQADTRPVVQADAQPVVRVKQPNTIIFLNNKHYLSVIS